jgi:Uma2 family endonuclease
MVQQLVPDNSPDSCEPYPDTDGQPMADNTKQFRWIVTIKENLERRFASEPDVFVAGDLLWYPVEGNPKCRQAPDVLVVFGRPKGDRGSYKQWQEADIAPQVVFEILSSGNRSGEMLRKLNFYQRYGVEEYYIYDPDANELTGLLRSGKSLQLIGDMVGWISPRLGIRFQLAAETLTLYHPDGERFLTYGELAERLATEREQRQQDEQRIASLEAKLRELGVDPQTL